MNNLDASFITQVQLAIIGVILVTGLFYIWRIVGRIETKVDQFLSRQSSCQQVVGGQNDEACVRSVQQQQNQDPGQVIDLDDSNEAADILMKSVFGDVFMMSSGGGHTSGVQVTEIVDDEDDEVHEDKDISPKGVRTTGIRKVVEVEDSDEDEETPSVAATATEVSSNKLSKSKLKAMGVNMLKELCQQRNLSQEGAKQALVDRILAATDATQE